MTAQAAVAQAKGKGSNALPVLVFADGTIEAIKWLALLLMTLDHVNKYLLADSVHALFALGRVAMPLFAFVLAYNLARPGALAKGAHLRTMKRLALYGALATPAFVGLGGLVAGWWPLNILWMLFVATAVIYLIELGGTGRLIAAAAFFAFGGFFVEFWWPALGFCLACWAYCRKPSWLALVGLTSCCAALWFINNNLWALVALPVIFAGAKIDLPFPRWRHVFYVYYPVHLTALWAINSAI